MRDASLRSRSARYTRFILYYLDINKFGYFTNMPRISTVTRWKIITWSEEGMGSLRIRNKLLQIGEQYSRSSIEQVN